VRGDRGIINQEKNGLGRGVNYVQGDPIKRKGGRKRRVKKSFKAIQQRRPGETEDKKKIKGEKETRGKGGQKKKKLQVFRRRKA